MLRDGERVYYISSTRFNNDTWRENARFRLNKKHTGCAYGVPRPITAKIPLDSAIFVLEMNNSSKQIMGIGYIRNRFISDKHYKIYSNASYNRYYYEGRLRIDRAELLEDEEDSACLKLLEVIVFNGKDHIMRGDGFITVPQKKIGESTGERAVLLLGFLRRIFKRLSEHIKLSECVEDEESVDDSTTLDNSDIDEDGLDDMETTE